MEIIVIDMRGYRQMTGLCVTNAEHCESNFTKERRNTLKSVISKKNLPTFENNKGLAKLSFAQSKRATNADSLLKINKEPNLVELLSVMTNE
jgi:hypothetical protein